MTDEKSITRRAAVAGGAAALLGGAGLYAMSGGATAQVQTGVFSVSDTSIETDAGLLEEINVTEVNVVAEYQGFNYQVDETEFELEVTHEDTGESFVVDTDVDGEPAIVPHEPQNPAGQNFRGEVETQLADFDLVEEFGQEAFEVFEETGGDNPGINEDDVTESFDVTFELTATVSDIEGNDLSDTATGNSISTVTNLATEVDVGGEAEIAVEEDTEGPRPFDAESVQTEPGQQQTDQLAALDVPDPFTVVAEFDGVDGEETIDVEIAAHQGDNFDAPRDSNSGDLDVTFVNEVTQFTIGTGSDADFTMIPTGRLSGVDAINSLSVELDDDSPDSLEVEV